MEGGDGGFGVGLGAREVGGGFLAAGEVARAEEDGVGVWGLGEEGGGGVAETLVCTWGGRLVDCGDGGKLGERTGDEDDGWGCHFGWRSWDSGV